MATPKKFSDQIRRAIDRSGMTRYQICKRLEFSESVMSKFMKGKCGLSIDTLDRLGDLLGFRITTAAMQPSRRRQKSRNRPMKAKVKP